MRDLSLAMAETLARIALGHVSREYPNKLDHVLAAPDDARTPRDLHPAFYGSFDWHSCVHSFWLLARLRRMFPVMAAAVEIRALFDQRLTRETMAAECAYLDRPSARGFERPYGWAWALKLTAELDHHTDYPWADVFAPLADRIAQRFADFLPRATYPVRAGTHANTAFALAIAADFARSSRGLGLLPLFSFTAHRWYRDDLGCPAWEPDGEDFLSPALTEALCMRQLLPPEAFRIWLDRFLPDLHERRPATLFEPVTPSDRTDGRLAHLDGLNFSRAWCWRSIAAGLLSGDPRRVAMMETADAHVAQSLPFLSADYMGEHWLASFVLLALDHEANEEA